MKFPIHKQSTYTRNARAATYSVFDQFKYWYYDEFVNDPLYRSMSATCEVNSPWHIEANVGIHTTMVVTEYLVRSGQDRDAWNTDNQHIEGAFAAAFHDAGKPRKIVEKHSEERGDYVSFPGHEQYSARMWENWAISNLRILGDRFGLTVQSIYNVSWMIEHHLPWSVKNAQKRNALAQTCYRLGLQKAYPNLLWADTLGRISKDAVEKREKVSAWVVEYMKLVNACEPFVLDDMKPLLVIPIGASGSGKTTVLERVIPELTRAPFEVWSLDALRHQWYDVDDYTNAYTLACADKEFMNKAQALFAEHIRSGVNLFVDNTNLSRKRRAFYVNMARQHGYTVIAIPMLIDLDTLASRQKGRDDKVVPWDAVKGHYFAVQQPQYGEFDIVHVHDGNLPVID